MEALKLGMEAVQTEREREREERIVIKRNGGPSD